MCSQHVLGLLLLEPQSPYAHYRARFSASDGDLFTRIQDALPEFLKFPNGRPALRLQYIMGVSLIQSALDSIITHGDSKPQAAGAEEEEEAPKPANFGGSRANTDIIPRGLGARVNHAVASVLQEASTDMTTVMNWKDVLEFCNPVRRKTAYFLSDTCCYWSATPY